MKALRYIFLLGSVGSLLTFSNCGGGGSTPEPIANQQFTKLSKTWKISTVTLDGTDRTAEYTAGPMTLTVSGTKGDATSYRYRVHGRPALSPWGPASDTDYKWTFGSDATQNITRTEPDQLAMNYTVDATALTISFSFSGAGYPGPRVGVVTGNWIFKFIPN